MTQVQGMTVTCPEGWLDKWMLVLSAAHPGPTGVSPSFVVTRELLPDDPATGTAARADFDEAEPVFRTMLQSFRIV